MSEDSGWEVAGGPVGGEDLRPLRREGMARAEERQRSILLVGRGTVGGPFLAQLEATSAALRPGRRAVSRLVGVVDRHGVHFQPGGLRAVDLPPRSSARPGPPPDLLPVLERLARLPAPVLVDCTAADGMEVAYREAFRRGIDVVAANKKPLALRLADRDGLLAEARDRGCAWHYETTVGSSLPVLETLQALMATGDVVERIEGSLSGTLGFLCHSLMAGAPLSTAVRSARERGYTEPHPRDDLSGLDVARKALILAREAGLPLELEDVAVEPFVPAPLLAEDDPERFLSHLADHDLEVAARIARLAAAGRMLRYLAVIVPGAERAVRVGPVAVDRDHPAVPLRGAEALVAFTSRRHRDYPLLVRGAGAGGEVTAAGVLADVLRLPRGVR
jgi:bifunctional aspartokinase / homoserine dehydrogenase 1